MKVDICGYLLLRKTEFNFDLHGRGAYSLTPPKINDLYYAGVDRMQWFDIDESFYTDKLPSNLVKLRKSMWELKSDSNDIEICTDFLEAKKLLKYSNGHIKNELIAINSSCFNTYQSININANFMGYDIYCNGYGSIIRNGIFRKPELFPDVLINLNSYGLFDDLEHTEKYIRRYKIEIHNEKLEGTLGEYHEISLYTPD